MNLNHAQEAIKLAFSAQQAIFLEGSPGLGKTEMVYQIADAMGIDVETVLLSQLDSVDLRGIPSVTDGLTCWNTPKFLPVDGKGILFLDEITSASQQVQVAAYQLILERRLGDYVVPDGWHIVAAGNKQTDRAVVNPMSSALKNRFITVEVSAHFDTWLKWALKNGINPMITGFLRYQPDKLTEFDGTHTVDAKQKAYATPRSWSRLSHLLDIGIPEYIQEDIIAGVVGAPVSANFHAFVRNHKDLPQLAEIISRPDTTPIPSDKSALFAVTSMLAFRMTGKNCQPLMQYAQRMHTEMQVILLQDAMTRSPELMLEPSITEWTQKHQDVLFA